MGRAVGERLHRLVGKILLYICPRQEMVVVGEEEGEWNRLSDSIDLSIGLPPIEAGEVLWRELLF